MSKPIRVNRIHRGTALLWIAIAFAVASGVCAADTDRTIKTAVADALAPAPAEAVHFSGRLEDKIDACINNRLLTQNVEDVVAPYRAKREVGAADWRCEYWGKWYTSLALADAYRSTDATRSMRDQGAKELLVTAAPDGYLGTREPEHRLDGWDVWGRKYAMLGVLAYYDRTHDAAALTAARRHADTLITELGPDGKNIEDVGEWNGLPASSVLEPIVQLYERTGDAKYLDFANYIVACWQKPSKRVPRGMRLVDDALAGKEPSQMCAPKSYEMMSCFEGLCELYRATGNRDFLNASIKLSAGVDAEESNLVGCGTSNEIWFDGAKKQTHVVPKPMETCVTATWMKLEYQLLRLTGDEHYADELEKNLYNGLLGAMMPDGRWWAYFSGMMGCRVPSYIQHDDVGLSCCVVNGPRGLMITPSWAFMSAAEGPVVNLYAPATAQLSTPAHNPVDLEIKGDYPVGDSVEILVNPSLEEEFTLSLRIPAWSEKTDVRVAGASFEVTPGTYAKIHRRWKSGDRVAITFDMRGRMMKAPDGNGQIALLRGPMVLSLDNRLAPANAGQVVITAANDGHIDLKSNPAQAAGIGAWMAFDVPCTRDNNPATLTFCEYVAAGNAFTEQNTFRTWLPQPLDDARVYNTGQTWKTLSHSAVWTNPPPAPRRVEDAEHDVALAIHGSTATADSEYSKQDSAAGRVIDGILSENTGFENKRWHSSTDTPHPHWVEITLGKPSVIARAVIDPADPAGYPVRFEGQIRKPGETNWTRVFRCEKNIGPQPYVAEFQPIEATAFRVVIEESANPNYPNAAQLSEIELYPTYGKRN